MHCTKKGWALVLAPFMVVCLSACPIDGPEGDGGPLTDEEKVEALIEGVAKRYAECASEQLRFTQELDPALTEVLLSQIADLEDQVRANFEQIANSDKVEIDVDSIDPCLDAINAARCEVLLDSAGPEACIDIFRGTVEENGECALEAECADGYCVGVEAERCGGCVPYAQENEPCGGDVVCAPGLNCGVDVCERPAPPPAAPKAGDSCSPQTGCGNPVYTGLICLSETSTCVEVSVVNLGETCDVYGTPDARRLCKNMLSTTYCDADLAAGETSGVCVPRPTTGEACGGIAMCNLLESECFDDTCVGTPGEGEACHEIVSCAVGLSCVDGVCKRPVYEAAPLPVCGG